MGLFHSADVVATTLGFSLRHIRRISKDAGVVPAAFGTGRRKTFKWTDGHIEQIRVYLAAPKKRKVPKRYERRK